MKQVIYYLGIIFVIFCALEELTLQNPLNEVGLG